MHYKGLAGTEYPILPVTSCGPLAQLQGAFSWGFVPYLSHGARGSIRFLHVLGGHRGVAGADEHWGADLHHVAPRGRMHHPVEGVQGCCDGELAGPLPPRSQAPSEGGRVGCLATAGGGHQGQVFRVG